MLLFSIVTASVAVDVSGGNVPLAKMASNNIVADSASRKPRKARQTVKSRKDTAQLNAVHSADSVRVVDSTLQIVFDSLRTDTLHVDSLSDDSAKKSGLDAPVQYEANDSTAYDADTRLTMLSAGEILWGTGQANQFIRRNLTIMKVRR